MAESGSQMWKYHGQLMNWVDHLSRWDWTIIMFGVVVIGAICMRGFGSRTNY